MGGFQETEAAVLPVRDPALRQLHLEIEREVGGPEEDGDLREGDAMRNNFV